MVRRNRHLPFPGPNTEQILVIEHVVALFGGDIASHRRFKSASLRRTTVGAGQSHPPGSRYGAVD
jgi:hypothetical protein